MTDATRAATDNAPLVLTMGEPAGIGGEIALKAWQARATVARPFFVLDSPDRLARLADRCAIETPIRTIDRPSDAAAAIDRGLPVLPLGAVIDVSPGTPDPDAGKWVIAAIARAVDLAQNGEASGLVTNPIHKAALYAAGFGHPGHTEYLAELGGLDGAPIMMLACDALRVVPVTIHLALREAIDALSADAIVHAARITAAALQRDFAIDAPRLAVAGLNPHAGEGGHMGREELDIIEPALTAIRSAGIDVVGPMPPDTMFHGGARAEYDAAICMYHDQALIPLKTLDFAGGVNVTLGLPFIRTSPDHGTAFDIAGTGTAEPASLLAAMRMAAAMADARRKSADRAA